MRHGQTDIGEIGGRWSHVMDFKSTKVRRAHASSPVETNMQHYRTIRNGCCLTL